MIRQTERNEQLGLAAFQQGLTTKYKFVFVFNTVKKLYSRDFILTPIERVQLLLKKIFKIAPRLGDRHVTIIGNFEGFQYFETLKQIF